MESGDDVNRTDEAEAALQGVEPRMADLLSDLLSEMKENNRLLRALNAGKAEADTAPATLALPSPAMPEVTQIAEKSKLRATTARSKGSGQTADRKKPEENIRTQVDQLHKSVVDLSENRAVSLRKTMFDCFHSPVIMSDSGTHERRSHDVLVQFKEKPEDRTKLKFTDMVWKATRSGVKEEITRHLADYGDQWTLKPAVDMRRMENTIVVNDPTGPWSFSVLPIHGTGLFFCNGGSSADSDVIRPASERDIAKSATAMLAGSFWTVSMRARLRGGDAPRHVRLDYLSLICTIMVAMGMRNFETIEFLRTFFEKLPASPRQPLSSSSPGPEVRSVSKRRSYIHHIRFFAPSRTQDAEGDLSEDNVAGPGTTYHRVEGLLDSIGGEAQRFEEHRITIICSEGGFLNPYANENAMFVMVLEDITTRKIVEEPIEFRDWEKRGFKVVGATATHHLLQATLHAVLGVWAEQWAETLNALDDLVSTEVEDIMSRKTSETLMFDSGFERSRIYFKTLQILRIFTQMIERTRRDVELFNPQVSVSDWMLPLMRSKYNRTRGEDAALLANWDILWSFYVQKEEYLLRRLLNKTEELKSLRDGLFNGTALLEASRSTTMNRYVIVFTVMTILYLPPSLVATIFGTDLFNSDDTAETVTDFKVATVVTSITTYVLGILLIWMADRLDLPGVIWGRVTTWWRDTFQQVMRRYDGMSWRERIMPNRKKIEEDAALNA